MAKSNPSSGSLLRARPHGAAHPVAAGFRPAAAALAIAIAFTLHGASAWAQPVPQAVIHGGAKFTQNGANLVVNTTNGANTSHSAINWTSFSVPAGSVTQFIQPSASSTSINRVVAPNPSEIFGRLASNGRLVLVNPWGIAVGQGAQVDTAGFTASTLAMSEADAIAGRMRFAGGDALLKVDGAIRAQGGDIVLIAPKLETGAAAVVEADGAAVLAAGRQVEITGRGLEGIHMTVQAGTEAVNLGSLKGDAVGMFAGTLRHSGLVQAQAVSAEGGKVVLKAAGDALVDGAIAARRGDQGGAVDVLGERVGLLAGARIDASGAAGGGSVRIGGDYQGLNAEVPNAKRTYVDAQASINADAAQQGDGGRVIVWSDEATRMHGQISARGGAAGGDGGFAEVSGKQYLEFTGAADLRAPQGSTGTLLLDPNNITISTMPPTNTGFQSGGLFQDGPGDANVWVNDLNNQLALSNVRVTTGLDTTPQAGVGQITLASGATVAWNSGTTLTLEANNGILLEGAINATDSLGSAGGTLHLSSNFGSMSQAAGSTIKVDRLLVQGGGDVWLTGPGNLVNTLAGNSGSGAGFTFAFKNAKDLTVASVSSAGGSSFTGVNSAWGSGRTQLETTAGSLRVIQQVGGHSISLKAADDVNVQNAYVQSSGPSTDPTATLSLTAGRDVLVGSEAQGTYTYNSLHGTAGTIIEAARHFRAGATNSNVNINGYGIGVKIKAATGDAEFAPSAWVNPYGGDIDVWAQGSIVGSGNFSSYGSIPGRYGAGTVVLEASTGSLSFASINSNGSYSAPRGGNVTLKAQGHVTGNSITASGSSTSPWYTTNPNDAAGGEVRVTSNAGNISINSIEARGGYGNSIGGGPGGKILLSAPGTGAGAGSIFIGSRLDASGGDSGYVYYEPYGYSGGAGGLIQLSAHKDIQVGKTEPDGYGGYYTINGQVQAWGGQASVGSLGSAPGGQGGQIYMSALTGNILLVGYSSVDAHGGSGQVGPEGEPSGQGGLIDLQAGQGSITGSRMDVRGGSGRYASAGGAGGTINVVAGQDLTLASATSYDGVSADGGGSEMYLTGDTYLMGTGGAGGSLTLRSTGGNVAAANMAITSRGGSGYHGGAGGTIQLDAGNGIGAAIVDASGASSSGNDSMPGGTGGDGGSIDVLVRGALDVPFLHARGGSGGTAGSTTPGGNGGTGGGIDVHFSGPSGVLDLVDFIDVSGGPGGSIPSWLAGGTAGAPGNGGAGGAIFINGGDLRIGSTGMYMQMHARGGQGGSGSASAGVRGTDGGIEIASGNIVLDNLFAQGDMFVAATGGVATSAGSQLNVYGKGVALEAGTGLNLAGFLQAYGDLGPGGVSLHTATGHITQTGGFIMSGGLLARADTGNVSLPQGNFVQYVAGASGGTFELVNASDYLDITGVSSEFAAVSGVVANGGASIRTRGEMRVSSPVTSAAGSVLLRSGDTTISGGYSPSGGSGSGGMRILALVQAGGNVTVEGNAGFAPGVEISAGEPVEPSPFSGPGSTPQPATGSLQAGGALVVRGSSTSGPGVEIGSETSSPAVLQAGGTLDVFGTSSADDVPGVMLVGNVRIDSGGTATVSGEYLGSTGFAPGVLVGEQECTTSLCKLTGTGALRLVGTGNGPGAGVMVDQATIDRTGALELLGTSAFGTEGVLVGASMVRTGGGNALFVSPQTVAVNASTIDTGGGMLALTGGSTTHDGPGVLISGGSSLHAGTGAVAIMGVSEFSPGFAFFGASGGLTVSGADVEIVGRTVQNGEALVIDNETVSSTNSMRLVAEGGALVVRNGSTISNTGPGTLVMNSTAGPGGPSLVNIEAGNTVTSSGGGDIRIIADDAAIDGTVNSGTARIVIMPLDTTRRILINAVDDSLGLNFTQAELDRMTGATVLIGDIALSGGISIEGATLIGGGRALSLVNGGAIQQKPGATLTVNSLNADGASVVLDELVIGGTGSGSLSGRARAGDFLIGNWQGAGTNLQIGTVDGIAGVAATGGMVAIGTSGTLQLSQPVKSDAGGTAIALAAGDFKRDGSGALEAPNGRWLVWLPKPTANLVGAPVSGNLALWGRKLDTTLPPPIAESGNRYVFELAPSVTVKATDVVHVYDGTTNFGTLGYTATGLVDAASFGGVFLQDAFSGALALTGASQNAATYADAIQRGTLAPPTGYTFAFLPGTLLVKPRPLTIAASNLNKVQGEELVFAGTEFDPKATGVGSETVTTVSLASEGAPAAALAGAYPIIPSNAVGANGFLAGNYEITYLQGALAVFPGGEAPAVVQVNNQVVTFATLFVEEAKTQPSIQADEDWKKDKEDRAKDDIVITDTACKP